MSTLELKPENTFAKLLTGLLLFGSTVLVLFDIRAALDIYYALFALLSSAKTATDARVQSTLGGSVLMFVLGLAAIFFIIYMFEHHMRRAGRPGALRPVLITLAVQAALVAISLVV